MTHIEKAKEQIEKQITSLESQIKPSESAYDRRLEEIKRRRDRYDLEIKRAARKAKQELLEKTLTKKEQIIELRAAVDALDAQMILPSLEKLREATFDYFSDLDDDEGKTIAEFCNRIAGKMNVQPSIQFSRRLEAALRNDIRFLFNKVDARYSLFIDPTQKD